MIQKREGNFAKTADHVLIRGTIRQVFMLKIPTIKIIYVLLTKREVKMAGYWPISFFEFFGQ